MQDLLGDRYTSIRKRRACLIHGTVCRNCRTTDSACELSTPQSRAKVLETLVYIVQTEEQKLEGLSRAFDLYQDSSDCSLVEESIPWIPVSTSVVVDVDCTTPSKELPRTVCADHNLRPATSGNSLADDTSLSLTKSQFLSTPVRMKYFPSLSSSILEGLLRTPSVRESTPDYCSETSPSNPLALDPSAPDKFPKHTGLPSCAYPPPFNVKALHRNTFGLLETGLDQGLLPLTPPPSSRIPEIASFPPSAADLSCAVALDHGSKNLRAASPNPFDMDWSRDVRSPLSESVPDARPRKLRACKSDLHTYAPLHKNLAATLELEYGTVSPLAFRNFQRVILELKGSETEIPDNTNNSLPSADDSSCVYASKPLIYQSPDGLIYRNNSIIGPVQLPHVGLRMLPEKSIGGASNRSHDLQNSHRVLTATLNEEFAALLLDQAADDETTALGLRELARTVERMACTRRQLAKETVRQVADISTGEFTSSENDFAF